MSTKAQAVLTSSHLIWSGGGFVWARVVLHLHLLHHIYMGNHEAVLGQGPNPNLDMCVLQNL